MPFVTTSPLTATLPAPVMVALAPNTVTPPSEKFKTPPASTLKPPAVKVPPVTITMVPPAVMSMVALLVSVLTLLNSPSVMVMPGASMSTSSEKVGTWSVLQLVGSFQSKSSPAPVQVTLNELTTGAVGGGVMGGCTSGMGS